MVRWSEVLGILGSWKTAWSGYVHCAIIVYQIWIVGRRQTYRVVRRVLDFVNIMRCFRLQKVFQKRRKSVRFRWPQRTLFRSPTKFFRQNRSTKKPIKRIRRIQILAKYSTLKMKHLFSFSIYSLNV
jgi:hypothetical protein